MKKKVLGIIAAVVILATCIGVLAACNSYKWDSLGGGDSSAAVISNGGYYVEQGNYAYYINGYYGSDADNTWGDVVKQSIVRAEIKDGAIDTTTAKVLVPLSIYNESEKGGIAIFGEWIYYATPNYDKDNNGTASTTNTDFMRTKIDGTITQKLGTIATRSAEYFFTRERVIYYVDSTISYIDFSDMKTNKSTDTAGGEKGTIAENVTSFVWDYDAKYEGASIADYFYYTQTITGDDSYKNYNNLYMCDFNGNKTLLATETTFVSSTENAVDVPQKVFKYSLVDMYLDSDSQATIYYTKTYSLNSEDTSLGLFMNKIDTNKSFDTATEKTINVIGSTTLYPLGYEEGCIAFNSNSEYCWYKGAIDGQTLPDPVKVTSTSQTIWYVDQATGYAYYCATSSPTTMYKIYYKSAQDNASVVVDASITIDWLNLDIVDGTMYFFDGDDDNYLHSVNMLTFDNTDEDAETVDLSYGQEETEDSDDEDEE